LYVSYVEIELWGRKVTLFFKEATLGAQRKSAKHDKNMFLILKSIDGTIYSYFFLLGNPFCFRTIPSYTRPRVEDNQWALGEK
jgi:hypothetical protein